MAESPKKQELDDLLKGPVDRSSFDRLVKGVHSSFKAVDWATDYVKELRAGLDGASDSEQRDQWEKVGILSFALGHYKEAVEALEHVRTRKEAAHFLGRACLELNRPQEALAALDAGRQGEDDLATDMLVVDALCRERDAEAARKVCERYRDAGAEDPDWLYGMGRVLETEGAYEEAMAHYERALERDAGHRASMFRLALNCDLNGEDVRALELYKRCASLNPTFVGALTNLGVLYEDKEDYGGAIGCYKRVLAIDPSHKRVQLYLKDAEASLSMHVEDERTRRLGPGDEIMLIPLSNFELSARSRSVLEKLNVKTLGDLCRLSEKDLLQFKNFGETSLDEVKSVLARYNLTLAGFPSAGGPGMLQLGAPVDDEDLREKLNTPIELLGLATRSSRCVERLNITTVGELVAHTEEELLAVPNFGRTSVAEIKNTLAALGLSLRENENA